MERQELIYFLERNSNRFTFKKTMDEEKNGIRLEQWVFSVGTVPCAIMFRDNEVMYTQSDSPEYPDMTYEHVLASTIGELEDYISQTSRQIIREKMKKGLI